MEGEYIMHSPEGNYLQNTIQKKKQLGKIGLKILIGLSETVNLPTNSTKTKNKMTKERTLINKTLHRRLNIEKHQLL